MKRTLKIRNALSHREFECVFSPGATLVTGRNSAGKTSLCRILAALTAQTTNPAHLPATATKAYVTRGEFESWAELDGCGRWNIADGAMERGANEEKPRALPHTAGLIDFVSGKTALAARVKVFEDLFMPADAAPLIRAAWGEPRGDDRLMAQVIRSVGENGWDAAAGNFDELKRDAGRAWRGVTGEIYSKRKAAGWRPPDWSSDLEGRSEEDLRLADADARDALNALQVEHAVSQDRIDRAETVRDRDLPEKRAEMSKAADEAAEMKTRFDRAKKAFEAACLDRERLIADLRDSVDERTRLKKLESDLCAARHAPLSCPHCGEPVSIEAGKPVKFDRRAADAEIEKVTAEWTRIGVKEKKLEAAAKEGRSKAAELGDAARDAKTEWETARRERARLEAETAALEKQAEDAGKTAGAGNEAERSALENAVSRSRRDISAFSACRRAAEAHENYVEYERIAKLLGPAGARKAAMDECVGKIRRCLESISGKAGWLPIGITPNYEITSGGHPVQLAAENERRKAQWAIQTAVAMMRPESEWLLIDAADLLRGDSWNGLVRVVDAVTAKLPNLHAVVFATETETPEGWREIKI